MKRAMSLMLAVLLMLSLAACGGDSSGEGDMGAHLVSLIEAQAIAKQEVVNELCEESGVSQIYLNAFNITETKALVDGWSFVIKGNYNPIDDYGREKGTETYYIYIVVYDDGHVYVQ